MPETPDFISYLESIIGPAVSENDQAAISLFELYSSFLKAGFNEEQAFTLLLKGMEMQNV